MVHTDRSTYGPGESATITVIVTNTGPGACSIAQPYAQTFGSTVEIVDPSGSVVWAPGARAMGVLVMPRPISLSPGQSYTWTTAMWDLHYCQGSCATNGPGAGTEGAAVPAGAYRAQPLVSPPSPAQAATLVVTG